LLDSLLLKLVHRSELLPSDDEDGNGGNGSDDDDDNGGSVFLFIVALLGTVVAVPSAIISLLLGPLSSMMIQISLVFSPFSFFLSFIGSFVTMNCPAALFSLIMALMGAYYAATVWHKVPFATANLQIALAAIKDNHGLWIIAYAVKLKMYVWITLWLGAALEMVVFQTGWVTDCSSLPDDDYSDWNCTMTTRGKFIALGMLLSLYWTTQVIRNVFRTAIAGVVGTWWFDPDEARSASARGNGGLCGCCGCSTAIVDSWIRSGIHSLGSIALGSLLIAILKVVQLLVTCGRGQRDRQRRLRGIEGTDFAFCLLQFIVDKLERLMEYINMWALVYVGLYGYDYWTAGKQVSGLFRQRGWDVIITDNLVSRSLGMMSIFICIITGLLGLLLGFVFLGFTGAIYAFILGFLLGGSSCLVLFGVVTSAVNTVVVCFAESPNSLRENGHDPEHFNALVDAYRTAYPNECGF
jgi:hypothetical protein